MTVTSYLPETGKTQTRTNACRFCGSEARSTVVDLGMSPLCETYPALEDFNRGEVYYPLHVYVCKKCFLVQLDEFETCRIILRGDGGAAEPGPGELCC